MPGCQGVKVEAGVSPALCRNCKSQDKPGNLPRFAPQSTFSALGGGLDDMITNITQPMTELGYFFSEVIMKTLTKAKCRHCVDRGLNSGRESLPLGFAFQLLSSRKQDC